jgi:hypothetical protein
LGVVVAAVAVDAVVVDSALHRPCLEFGPPTIPDLISSYLQHPVGRREQDGKRKTFETRTEKDTTLGDTK